MRQYCSVDDFARQSHNNYTEISNKSATVAQQASNRNRPQLAIWQLWQRTFARQYLRSKHYYGEADSPEWVASIGVSMMMLVNLFCLSIVIGWVIGIDVTAPPYEPPKLVSAAITIALPFFNYMIFVHRGAADKLIHDLSLESRRARIRGERLLRLYEVGSLAMPVVLGIISLILKK